MSPVRYELGFISEDGIRHNHHRENLKSYIALTGWAPYEVRSEFLYRRRQLPS
jgi:hypothetical protein